MNILDFLRDPSFYPYVYTFGAILIGIPTFLIYLKRPDLRKLIKIMALVLLPFPPFASYYFIKDYWTPTDIIGTLFGMPVVAGDFIFTFTVVPLFTTVYLFIRKKTLEDIKTLDYKKLVERIVIFHSIYFVLYALLLQTTGLNSVIGMGLMFAAITIAFIIKRHDLILPVIETSIIFGIGAIVFYTLYQQLIGSGFLEYVWLLDHAKYSKSFFGVDIPYTEVFFAITTAPFYLFLVPFLLNKKLVNLKSN